MGLSNIQVKRGAESWQFCIFVFGTFVTLFFGIIDEIPSAPYWQISLMILAVVSVGYFTLINTRCRNWLVGILNRVTQEQHG